MINTCCNLYFYYNFIVHGGIRHLENTRMGEKVFGYVHGGIRHLEIIQICHAATLLVHGGIRHLEISKCCLCC